MSVVSIFKSKHTDWWIRFKEKREVCSYECLHLKKIRKISVKWLNDTDKILKQEQVTPKVSKWKEIINVRTEIDEINSKRTIQRLYEAKNCVFEKIKTIGKHLAKVIKRKREKGWIWRIMW
jgi:hypothetical protein